LSHGIKDSVLKLGSSNHYRRASQMPA
jgi:hypothetical protein